MDTLDEAEYELRGTVINQEEEDQREREDVNQLRPCWGMAKITDDALMDGPFGPR